MSTNLKTWLRGFVGDNSTAKQSNNEEDGRTDRVEDANDDTSSAVENYSMLKLVQEQRNSELSDFTKHNDRNIEPTPSEGTADVEHESIADKAVHSSLDGNSADTKNHDSYQTSPTNQINPGNPELSNTNGVSAMGYEKATIKDEADTDIIDGHPNDDPEQGKRIIDASNETSGPSKLEMSEMLRVSLEPPNEMPSMPVCS